MVLYFQYQGEVSNQLQFLETKIISNDECRARHNILNRRLIYDNVICTYTQTDEGICLGDSGGPLVVQQVLVGIMSWVVPCGRGVPDAYARISAHYEWIVAAITVETNQGETEETTLKFSPLEFEPPQQNPSIIIEV